MRYTKFTRDLLNTPRDPTGQDSRRSFPHSLPCPPGESLRSAVGASQRVVKSSLVLHDGLTTDLSLTLVKMKGYNHPKLKMIVLSLTELNQVKTMFLMVCDIFCLFLLSI